MIFLRIDGRAMLRIIGEIIMGLIIRLGLRIVNHYRMILRVDINF